MAPKGDLTSQAGLTCEADLASGVILIGEVKPKLLRSIWLLRVRFVWDKLGYHDMDLKSNFFDIWFL